MLCDFPELVPGLCLSGADPNAAIIPDCGTKETGALHYAASRGRIALVLALLAARADIDHQDQTGETALVGALRSGKDEMAALLIKRRANLHGTIVAAASSRSLCDPAEMMRLLISQGADVPETPLHVLSDNSVETLDILLDSGAHMERLFWDMTPLHAAISRQNLSVVQALIAGGANVNAKNEVARSALHMAIRSADPEIAAEMLRSTDLDIEAKDAKGRTAVHVAIVHDAWESLQLLAEKNADFTAIPPGSDARTALTLSIERVQHWRVTSSTTLDPAVIKDPGRGAF
ncbi:Putative ankyrin repeat-containing domain superfamily [Septoria linicola]|uniref:protein S-acyltransferase n=1 Tax=Septoria linicola TaxID=215465 RepID=A0A9Q9ENZ9_9PEZI|nr:putative ankyrin repeat-containing domain superfamily [Septoria linicola]USW57134.1 Putative ankyrin repeat-containing domain superfamily [Septoria linicola]